MLYCQSNDERWVKYVSVASRNAGLFSLFVTAQVSAANRICDVKQAVDGRKTEKYIIYKSCGYKQYSCGTEQHDFVIFCFSWKLPTWVAAIILQFFNHCYIAALAQAPVLDNMSQLYRSPAPAFRHAPLSATLSPFVFSVSIGYSIAAQLRPGCENEQVKRREEWYVLVIRSAE